MNARSQNIFGPWSRAVRVGLFLATTMTIAASAYGQASANPVLSEVELAFGSGDVKGLLANSADRIEIAVFGASRLFSRTQARYVLQTFFEEHPPRGFQVTATSASPGGLFAEGTYRVRGSGEQLRVYIKMRRHRNHWSLREVLIERPAR